MNLRAVILTCAVSWGAGGMASAADAPQNEARLSLYLSQEPLTVEISGVQLVKAP